MSNTSCMVFDCRQYSLDDADGGGDDDDDGAKELRFVSGSVSVR